MENNCNNYHPSGSNFLKLNSARAIMLLAIAILRVSELQSLRTRKPYSANWPTSLLCPCILIIRCHTELMCIIYANSIAGFPEYSKFKKKQQKCKIQSFFIFYLRLHRLGTLLFFFSPYYLKPVHSHSPTA